MKHLLRLAAVIVLSLPIYSCGNCSKEVSYYASIKNTLPEIVTVRFWSLGQKDTTETRTKFSSNESRLVYMRTVKVPESREYPFEVCADTQTTLDLVEFNPDTPYTICQVYWTYEIRAYGDSCT